MLQHVRTYSLSLYKCIILVQIQNMAYKLSVPVSCQPCCVCNPPTSSSGSLAHLRLAAASGFLKLVKDRKELSLSFSDFLQVALVSQVGGHCMQVRAGPQPAPCILSPHPLHTLLPSRTPASMYAHCSSRNCTKGSLRISSHFLT